MNFEELSRPVAECRELSQRTRNVCALMDIEINTVGDLLAYSPCDFLKEPNFGRVSLRELEAFLDKRGLKLGDTQPVRESLLQHALLASQAY